MYNIRCQKNVFFVFLLKICDYYNFDSNKCLRDEWVIEEQKRDR